MWFPFRRPCRGCRRRGRGEPGAGPGRRSDRRGGCLNRRRAGRNCPGPLRPLATPCGLSQLHGVSRGRDGSDALCVARADKLPGVPRRYGRAYRRMESAGPAETQQSAIHPPEACSSDSQSRPGLGPSLQSLPYSAGHRPDAGAACCGSQLLYLPRNSDLALRGARHRLRDLPSAVVPGRTTGYGNDTPLPCARLSS